MPTGREHRVRMDHELDTGTTVPSDTPPAEHPLAQPLAVLAAAPHDPAANRRAGYHLGREGHWPEALACWERVVAADPHDAEAWYSVGLAASHTGDQDQAHEALARLRAAN